MITPEDAADSLLTTLRLAELYQRWDLYGAVVRYVRDAGGRLSKSHGVWQIEIPEGTIR